MLLGLALALALAATEDGSLVEYTRKRNFKQTAEPTGKKAAPKARQRFVVQKHAATRLHYDFRLELSGVLKSWALPKGIPFAKGEKRLAVQVEDHPVDYLEFEGTIPKGQYGGGTVMVWDIGTFEPLSPSPEKDLASGKLHFRLSGKKLQGEWHLVRFRNESQWLLIKGGDSMRPVSKRADDESALSGKTMKQVAAGEVVWESNRPATAAATQPGRDVSPRRPSGHRRGRRGEASLPKPAAPLAVEEAEFIEPMKAQLAKKAPPAGDWIYEIKFDGFRAIAFIGKGGVRLLSRNDKDLGGKFPEVVDALQQLEVRDAVIDGEIVALDPEGRSSFQLLQALELGEMRPPLFYYAFDLLRLDGEDLMQQPLLERKSRLEKLLKRAPSLVRYSASLGDDAAALLPQVRKLGLEGLIGKKKDSVYEAGRRSGAWVKLKLLHEQEVVIGGYTNPGGSRHYFGALLIGYYEGKQLKFAGKVGTGFDSKGLKMLHARLTKLALDTCPFANLPERKNGKWGQNLTPAEMKRCHWVKPELVCQVKFSEWTRDGKLRQPVFLGLREDKSAKEVVREQPR
jgi:bifunctional non-homologous end joining protein LigD